MKWLACLLLIASCTKSNNVKLPGLEGTWHLKTVPAGMTPVQTLQIGTGNTITFKGSHYDVNENGTRVQSGEYKIVKDGTAAISTCLSIPAGQFTHRIEFGAKEDRKTFLQVTNNELKLLSGCFAVDAGVSKVYQKN